MNGPSLKSTFATNSHVQEVRHYGQRGLGLAISCAITVITRGEFQQRVVGAMGAKSGLTLLTCCVTNETVILSFACAETERLFRAEMTRRFPSTIQRSARRKLLALHAATDVRQMAVPPGNRLEALKGDRKGQYSIRVNDQWRICFRWQSANAHDAEIVDYH